MASQEIQYNTKLNKDFKSCNWDSYGRDSEKPVCSLQSSFIISESLNFRAKRNEEVSSSESF